MKEKIKKIFGDNKEIIQNYRFTFILIVINTILSLILYDEYDYNELLTALFLTNIFFFCVETFIKKDKPKLILLFISLFTSSIFNHLLYKSDNTPRVTLLIFGVYLISFLLSIYKISKKEKNFADYFLKVVNNNLVLSVAAIIIQMGLLFITFAITELLLPDSSFDIFARMEIIFAGLFVVPCEILCLTTTKVEVLKPLKFLSCYILLPIVLISMCIIYSYLIKIIATMTMPSNEVFTIITVLFVIAIPTYLLIINYDDNKFVKTFLGKLSYAFIPLVLMAMYSLGIRIYNHGITLTRYCGIIIIGLEIMFIILSFKKNHKYFHNLLVYSSILVLISLIMPYTNCISVSRTSQLRRLTNIYKEDTIYEELSTSDKNTIYSSYNYLIHELNSEKYIPKYIDKNKIMPSYIDYNEPKTTKTINYHNPTDSVPVKGYNYLETIIINQYDYYIEDMLLKSTMDEDLKETFKNELYNIIETGNITSPEITLSDNYTLYLDDFQITYNEKNKKVVSLNLDGYLLKK